MTEGRRDFVLGGTLERGDTVVDAVDLFQEVFVDLLVKHKTIIWMTTEGQSRVFQKVSGTNVSSFYCFKIVGAEQKTTSQESYLVKKPGFMVKIKFNTVCTPPKASARPGGETPEL